MVRAKNLIFKNNLALGQVAVRKATACLYKLSKRSICFVQLTIPAFIQLRISKMLLWFVANAVSRYKWARNEKSGS